MKKTLMICGIAYMIMCIGAGAWIIVKPEAYGTWTAKFLNGFSKVLEGGDK